MKKIEIITILDWYDGLVLGKIQPSWLVGEHLAGLVAWDPARSLRALICFPLDAAASERLSENSQSWASLQHFADAFVRKHELTTVIVVRDSDLQLEGDPRDVKVTDAFRDVSGRFVFDAELALKSDRQRWLAGDHE